MQAQEFSDNWSSIIQINKHLHRITQSKYCCTFTIIKQNSKERFLSTKSSTSHRFSARLAFQGSSYIVLRWMSGERKEKKSHRKGLYAPTATLNDLCGCKVTLGGPVCLRQAPGYSWSWAQELSAQVSSKYSLEKRDCAESEGHPPSCFVLQSHSFSFRLGA